MLAFGVHQCVDYHDGHDDSHHHKQVGQRQDRLGDGNRIDQRALCDLLKVGGGRSHRQRDGARKTGMPHHEAAVGRCDEQTIVDATQFLGNLLGKDNAYDEAKAPVEPTCQG